MPTPATEVRQSSARFNGIVNARHFDTTVLFEYGTDGNSFPNRVVAEPFRVTGDLDTPVSVPVAGLAKGTTYHYRIVASSAAGTTVTGSIAFRTTTEPTATVAGAVPLTSTSARVSGFVNPQGLPTQMVIEYGTDGSNFPLSVAAMPATADGLEEVPVSATLANLAQGETYYYRVRATSVGGIGWSSAASFRMATISGLAQIQPGAPPDAQGFLLVNLSPAQFQGTTLPPGWRFVGEHQWRPSGIPVGGLTTGNRDIEFRPVPGYIQPPRETVGVVSGEPATVVAGDYYEAAGGGAVGGLSVTLMPAALADPTVPVDERAQWRLLGEDDTKWRDSGTTLPNQIPGDYLVECKPVAGRATPPPVSVAVGAGSTVVATITYLVASAASGTQPTVLSFDTVTGSPGMPYAYAGQIRSRL
ncbi:MAG: fibronectin type III domain-containing protein, partial [Akkermansiaceae bacterium]|nr:fibronectin type III domain-containing protein [Akkermansiaceae bacterium]